MNPAIRYVLSHRPRCTQVEAFDEIAEQLTDKQYWRLAGHIFSRGTTPITPVYLYADLWLKIFKSPRPHRSHYARLPADRQKWEQMPDEITCYRGCGLDNGDGCFFSLDYSTAKNLRTLARSRRQNNHLTVQEVGLHLPWWEAAGSNRRA